MKKYFFLALLLIAQISFANVITGVAAIPDNYYNGVSGKKGADNILNALNDAIKTHKVLNYNALEDYYEKTDFYGDTLWDMYSTCRFTMAEANKPQSYVCDGWNKEHLVCQSWFSGDGMKSDLFNVYPTDARVNNIRSSYAYGEVSGSWGTGISNNRGHALGKVGTNTFSGYSGKVFEPYDDYKGDFARSFMYMVACYRNGTLNGGAGSAMFTSNPSNLTTYAQNLLLKWHRDDPVSEKEIDRNQAVYVEQNNRNPFIDYPDLAEYIWGDKVGQTVDLSSMTPTCDGGSATPGVKYGVTWIMFDHVLRIDSVRENSKPLTPPDDPETVEVLCIGHETFVGWSSTPVLGSTDIAPTLYRKQSDFPVVTADITYYAVFAHADTQQTGVVESSQTITFSALCADQTTPTSLTVGDVTLTFDKGSNSNAPKYFNNGTALRCYGGNKITVAAKNITQIDFTFGGSDGSNAITANTGTLEGAKWTGSVDAVTFTIGGSSGNRRITELKVTMNGEGSVTTYSDFLTSCGEAQAIENQQSEIINHKYLQDGHLYIEVNGQIYTITGQKIK